jgi:alkanesulfonate monooxygenase SsuD/methylene tetrahydromethanopterin reductase-like flavin-dependent oxidoreductase (luciferase family)
MAGFGIRFDLRIPPFSTSSHAEAYAACLDMCAWADERGAEVIALSEHHGVEDGYLPAPVTLAAAIAARTSRAMINVAALLVPLHDPVRLAEQLAVASLVSGGRVSFVAGLGYRQEELEMAGVPRRGRGRLMEAAIEAMRRAWTGEPFEWNGRTIRVTPPPPTPPVILVGGSTPRAARRAARLRSGFFPSIADPELERVYHEACAAHGFTHGFVVTPSGPGFVYVSDDPARDWERIGPHALYDAQTYAAWQPRGQRSTMHVEAVTLADVKASSAYAVLTPDETVALARSTGRVILHPLMGGMPPALGWEGLHRFEREVLPRLRP